MQLSARILTALAVLAFTVGVVASVSYANNGVSAATGTIDAMNVGACTTTNADALGINDCKVGNNGMGNTRAFFESGELDAAIEVNDLYATYAHDPKTGAEAPRGIVQNADLIKISIRDTGRDRRDPVLIAIQDPTPGDASHPVTSREGESGPLTTAPVFVDGDASMAGNQWMLTEAYGAALAGGSRRVVADALGMEPKELDDLKLEVPYFGQGTGGTAIFESSGSYTISLRGDNDANPFKPIAPNGVVKFFGRIQESGRSYDPFKDIGNNVRLDEDVISGESGTPAMVLNVDVPSGGMVDLQVIYYETSDLEDLDGGATYCSGADGIDGDGNCPSGASTSDSEMDVIYTDAEKKNNTALLVQAASDGNDSETDLFLSETGRFDGVYEGFLRLTDADGDGRQTEGGNAQNWGIRTKDATGSDWMDDEVAVLGVGNGPVIINYRDSSGQNRSFTIQIDIESPVIDVDSPIHNSRSDDEKPSFIGTINDGDSGLAADTFQLYVDNDPDDDAMVLSMLEAMNVKSGDPNNKAEGIDRRLEYVGYSAASKTYGVVMPDAWKVADPATGRGEKDYRSAEADEYANGSSDAEFADEIEIDFDERSGYTFPDGGFNHKIEFQALVRDLAGNVGFSDSDPAKPRFINDLGEKNGERTVPNVLGVFSKHIVWLDDVDPYIQENRTVTGFYGLNDDKEPIRDRSAVMVVFDNAVNGSLIDSGTFTLEYDDGSAIGIADVLVRDELVFLSLDETLASDARPMLSITEGREVEDLAGNILSSTEHIIDPKNAGDKVDSVRVRDGILPIFTLLLSGGSGNGVGAESSARLTNEAIDIAIESDEDINGAPRVAVVCSNVGWMEDDPDDDGNEMISRDLDDYVSNRTGYSVTKSNENNLKCGNAEEPITLIESSSLSRPGNNWAYAWRNPTGESKLPDGELTIVVWKEDRGGFDYYKDKPDIPGAADPRKNFGSHTAKFTLDTMFTSPLEASGGDVQPAPGTDVAEPRPFVLLDFAGEPTNVDVTKLTVSGVDVLASLDNIGENQFLYWPETLEYGDHTVVFDARDAADNEIKGTKFSFKVTQRDPFVLDIAAGWNAISFPADPIDTAVDSVFTEPSVDRVIGWNPMSSTGPWSIASRIDGVWSTSEEFAPLTQVTARYGYWVHSVAFTMQSVPLVGPINRETGGRPTPIHIPTIGGWNFVGVVDQDGDQTEGHFGKELEDSDGMIKAKDYMPSYVRAYTWDAIGNGYRILEEDDPIIIGDGIWVYFPGEGIAP